MTDLPAPRTGDDTPALTQALARGDEAAWRTFFDRYAHRLRGFLARNWYGEAVTVDDLLQDTLMRTVRHIRTFPDETVFWSWLTALARSAIADQGRKRSRLRVFLDRFRLELAPSQSTETDHSHNSGNSLEAALARLSPEDRQLINWKYEERRATRDIASLLGCSEKAAESRLTRCRKRLRRHLDRLR